MADPSKNPIADLSETQQLELSKFIETEQQKVKLQQAIHQFTSTCWPKCVSNIGNQLDKSEEQCLQNCVERFLDCNFHIIKRVLWRYGRRWLFTDDCFVCRANQSVLKLPENRQIFEC